MKSLKFRKMTAAAASISLPRPLAAALTTLAVFAAPVVAQDNPWIDRRPLNIAHRGGAAEAPEHTLYAYKTALPKGVTVLEIDVTLSLDGVLVVHHDLTLDRVTNGTGDVAAFTLKELKALDSAYWYSSVCEGTCNSQPAEDYDFRGVATGDVPPPAGFSANDFKIATLKEVLKAFPDVLMSIEIKGVAPDSIPTAEALAGLLRQYGRSTNVMIASFNDATTAAFKAYAPEINTTPGLSEVVSFVSAPGPLPDHVAFQVPRTFSGTSVPPLIIDPAHANNLSVYFFIDPSEETDIVYNELFDQGADGIITDRPTALEAVLQSRGGGYLYREPLPTTSALVKSSGALKVVAKTETILPIAPPTLTATAFSVTSNGGEMLDPLSAGEWKVLGNPESPSGWKYSNVAAPDGGPCKTLLIKRRSIKAICKSLGTIPAPLAPGANDAVESSLALGANRYCASAAAPHAVVKEGKLIKIKDAPAPADCP